MYSFVREAAKIKKNLLLMTGSLRPNPPPPSSVMAAETLERWKKKVPKKVIFSLMARPFTPPPLNGPAIQRRTFFAASLMENFFLDKIQVFIKILHFL